MRNLKRMGAILMALALVLSLNLTAFAAVEDTGFSDVAADAWYADAVEYVRDNGLMSGTSATTFAPDSTMTRAMLAATLYRRRAVQLSPAATALPIQPTALGMPTPSSGPPSGASSADTETTCLAPMTR